MFLLLIIVTTVVLLFLSKIRMGTLNNPLSYYLIWWAIWLFVSQFNLFDTYDVSLKVYSFLLINIVMFSIGYIVFYKQNHHKRSFINVNIFGKRIFALQLMLFVILLYYWQKYSTLFNQMTVLDARRIKFETGLLFSSGYEVLFFNYLVTFLVYFFILLTISNYLSTHKIDKNLYLSITNGIVYGFIGFGRFIYFDSAVFFITGFLLLKNIQKDERKGFIRGSTINYVKRFFVFSVFIIGGLFLSAYTTAVRTGHNDIFIGLSDAFQQFILYFTGPFRALDHYFSTFKNSFDFTFGRSTLAGLDEIVNNLLYYFDRSSIALNGKIGFYTASNIYIGGDNWFNSFYTCIMNFYMDLGIFGVIIIPFLYGAVAAKMFNIFNDNPNIYSLMLVMYFTYTTIASEFRWSFQSPTSWFILIYILLAVYKQKHRRTVLTVHKHIKNQKFYPFRHNREASFANKTEGV